MTIRPPPERPPAAAHARITGARPDSGHHALPKVIVSLYVLVSIFWIFISDGLLAIVIKNPQTVLFSSILKGCLFILVTSTLLYLLISRYCQAIRSQDAEILKQVETLTRVNQRLQATEARYTRLIDGSRDGYWDCHIPTGETYYSPRYQALLGYREDELAPTLETFYRLVHPEDLPAVKAAGQAYLETHRPYDIELRLRTKRGEYRWFQTRGQATWDAEGKPVFMAGSTTDITERKQLEEALRNQNLLLNTVLSNVEAHVYMKDREGRYLYANQGAGELLGRPVEEIIGKTDMDFLSAEIVAPLRALDQAVFDSGVSQSREEALVDREGRTRYFWSVKVPLVHAEQPDRLIGVSTNVTELHRLREELERQAMTDSLTGIPNRRRFYEDAERHFARARRYGEALSLLVLDIDHFKDINDTRGHQIGDQVLCGIAAHFRQALRGSDILGRVGGEEFAILLPHTDLDAAAQLADRLRQTLSEQRFAGDAGHQLGATVSIGVATLLPTDTSLDGLYGRADQALYNAKEQGRNRVAIGRVAARMHEAASLHLIWQSDYACGEPAIDEEHRELFRLANELLDLAMTEPAPDTLLTHLDALLTHVAEHFIHEEEILRRQGYPDLERHAALHQHLVESALTLRGHTAADGMDFGRLVEFLSKEVVSNHMLQEDRAFHSLFSERL